MTWCCQNTVYLKPWNGEVGNFFTWSMKDVCGSMDTAYGDPLKPNCYPSECVRHDCCMQSDPYIFLCPLFPIVKNEMACN